MYEERLKKLKIALVAVQLSILVFSMTLIIMMLSVTEEGPNYLQLYDNLYTAQNLYISITFGIFLAIYLIVLNFLTRRLSKAFPKFYKAERKRIITINSLIIASITIRIVNVIANESHDYNDFLLKSFLGNTIAYPMI